LIAKKFWKYQEFAEKLEDLQTVKHKHLQLFHIFHANSTVFHHSIYSLS